MIEAIPKALFKHLDDNPIGSPPLDVAYPRVDFTPPSNGRYLRVDYLPNRPETRVIKFTGPDQHVGLLTVAVVWSAGFGIIRAAEIADEIVALYKRGTELAADGGLRVLIYETPWMAAPIDEERKKSFSIPVTVPWSCSLARS